MIPLDPSLPEIYIAPPAATSESSAASVLPKQETCGHHSSTASPQTKTYLPMEMTWDGTNILYLSIPSPTSILMKLPIVTLEPTSFDKSFSTV